MKLIIIDENNIKEITQEELKEYKDFDEIRVIEYCKLKASNADHESGQVNALVNVKFTEVEASLIRDMCIADISHLEFEIANNPNLGDLEVINTKYDIKTLQTIASKFSL